MTACKTNQKGIPSPHHFCFEPWDRVELNLQDPMFKGGSIWQILWNKQVVVFLLTQNEVSLCTQSSLV